MRIVATSSGGLGHIHPLVPVLRAARAAGDDVLVAVPPDGVPKVRALGFDAVAFGVADPEDLGRVWGQLPATGQGTYVVAEHFTRLQSAAALPRVRAALDDVGADLVISEGVEFAGPLAAELAGVPNVVVGIAAMDHEDLDLRVVAAALDDVREGAGLPRTGLLPWQSGSAWISAIPPMLWRDERAIPTGSRWFRHEDAEGPEPTPRIPPPRRPHGGRPRVYATLGSVAGGQEFAETAYEGVLAGLGTVDADVLFTVGAYDPAQLGRVPPNVTVERYVPQAVAMDVDAVVSHAGCGTTVATLARGLPTVNVPMFADQPGNAARLAEYGAGLVVDVRTAATTLGPALTEVLDDPSYADAAQRVAAQIAARPSAGEVLADVLAESAEPRRALRAGALAV